MPFRPTDRRDFFLDAFGKLLREASARTARRVAPLRTFRPPGAASEIEFLATCTRCGDCIEICPVHAIRRAPAETGLAAGTPWIDPAAQACVVCEEMPCARVCETGALLVPADGWASVHMGVLTLDPARCITFQGVACGVCAKVCPVGERALAMDAGGHPVLRPEGCVGCGVCVTACVTSPSSLVLQPVEVA